MPDWVWVVVAGLVLAVLTPPFKQLYTWLVQTYVTARSESLARQLAPFLVRELNGNLGLNKIREDLDYVKNELTINGGETVKDRIFSIERQLERLLTDR